MAIVMRARPLCPRADESTHIDAYRQYHEEIQLPAVRLIAVVKGGIEAGLKWRRIWHITCALVARRASGVIEYPHKLASLLNPHGAGRVPAAYVGMDLGNLHRTLVMDRRLTLTICLVAALALSFWSTSRVPALNDKALMGGDTQLEAVGFATVIHVTADQPKLLQALYSTVNWLETNRKGMTFGVLFGAALMVMLSVLRKRSVRSGLGNTLLGVIIGAPLGVCVNCAAPIAEGLHSGGARKETMLAAMVSSPTLNIIVLTMLFSLFPLYMVALKLVLTVGFILIAIPILARWGSGQLQPAGASPGAAAAPVGAACDIPLDAPVYGWWPGLVWLAKNFLGSLWFVVRRTVPLMFVAGFLGALIITLIPWDTLAELVPQGSRLSRFGGLGIAALVGLTIPVPITFDVILPAILLSAGMPISYVMVLLFTLGIFSVYAFFIVWKSMPKRIVLSMTAVLLVLGVASGIVANRIAIKQEEEQRFKIYNTLVDASPVPTPTFLRHAGAAGGTVDESRLVADLTSQQLERSASSMALPNGLSVERISFARNPAADAPRFVKMEGEALGLDVPYTYSIHSLLQLVLFRGVATGDVHNDGWTDVAVTSDSGVVLFANQAGESFARQPLDVPGLANLNVMNTALVDLNDDGWLDVFVSSYGEGNWYIENRGGRFSGSTLIPLPNHPDAVMSGSVAFGDVDRDGDLDIAIGNWTHEGLVVMARGNPRSRNVLLRQDAGTYVVEDLPGIPGGSFSALFTDLNEDGYLDLVMANDLIIPDHFYLGGEDGRMRLVRRADEFVTHTGRSTMSLALSDLDNDLRQELYLGQISGRDGAPDLPFKKSGTDECAVLTTPTAREFCDSVVEQHAIIVQSRNRRQIGLCETVDESFRNDCIAVQLLELAGRRDDRELCDLFPETWPVFSSVCLMAVESIPDEPEASALAEEVQQFGGTNMLLTLNEDGALADRADEFGVEVGGWTWNAKFADLDNNEWQDLYVVNGMLSQRTREPNLLYMDSEGGSLVNRGSELGLTSYLPTNGYSYIDMDNDGDLDIISVPAIGPLLVYRNDLARGNAIVFELRDHVGNRFGLGSRVIVHYGNDGERHQIREIVAGGGFVSFDAPMAHFGLGEHRSVRRLEIIWSTGERTELEGPFAAGARYLITRSDGTTPEQVASADGRDRPLPKE